MSLEETNLDLAWRSHTAQESWAIRADTKASIIFTVNSALIVAILALYGQEGGLLDHLGGWRETVIVVGIGLCGLATVAAGVAVYPMLGRHRAHRHRRDTIYFGHLRHREPADLAAQLGGLTPQQHFDQLARQMIVMSRYNWLKHRTLQAALLMAGTGYLMIFALARR